MQPVPKACLRHRLDFLPGTLGREYKAVAFFLPNLYCSSPSSSRPPPPSISARAPSHSRAAAATSSRRRLFFSALGPASSARAGGPRPSSALARANLVVDVDSGDLRAPGPDTHTLSARSSTSPVVAPTSIAVAGPPRRRTRPLHLQHRRATRRPLPLQRRPPPTRRAPTRLLHRATPSSPPSTSAANQPRST